MNQTLYLVRHGVAVEHGTPGFADDDRPLTPKGEKKMKQVAQGLLALGVEVDRIVTSPLPRALRTAEIVAGALGASPRLEEADALRASNDAQAIATWLEAREERRLMIVGHNPAISDLVGLLTAGPSAAPVCELHKGGVACLRGEADGPRRLDWLARPRLLRRLR